MAALRGSALNTKFVKLSVTQVPLVEAIEAMRDGAGFHDHIGTIACDDFMERGGDLSPKFIAVTPEAVMIINPDFSGESMTTASLDGMRYILAKHKAVRYALVSETWIATSDKNTPRPDIEPRLREDKREGLLVLSVERAGTVRQTMWPIERDADGVRLGTPQKSADHYQHVGGRMAELFGLKSGKGQ